MRAVFGIVLGCGLLTGCNATPAQIASISCATADGLSAVAVTVTSGRNVANTQAASVQAKIAATCPTIVSTVGAITAAAPAKAP